MADISATRNAERRALAVATQAARQTHAAALAQVRAALSRNIPEGIEKADPTRPPLPPTSAPVSIGRALDETIRLLRRGVRSSLIIIESITLETIPADLSTQRRNGAQVTATEQPGTTMLARRTVRAKGQHVSLEGLLDVLSRLPEAQCALTGIDLVGDRFELELLVLGVRT